MKYSPIIFLSFVCACLFCACQEEIQIEGIEKGTFTYLCVVSGGQWGGSEKPNVCRCNETDCAPGVACMEKDNVLVCATDLAN